MFMQSVRAHWYFLWPGNDELRCLFFRRFDPGMFSAPRGKKFLSIEVTSAACPQLHALGLVWRKSSLSRWGGQQFMYRCNYQKAIFDSICLYNFPQSSTFVLVHFFPDSTQNEYTGFSMWRATTRLCVIIIRRVTVTITMPVSLSRWNSSPLAAWEQLWTPPPRLSRYFVHLQQTCCTQQRPIRAWKVSFIFSPDSCEIDFWHGKIIIRSDQRLDQFSSQTYAFPPEKNTEESVQNQCSPG